MVTGYPYFLLAFFFRLWNLIEISMIIQIAIPFVATFLYEYSSCYGLLKAGVIKRLSWQFKSFDNYSQRMNCDLKMILDFIQKFFKI